MRYQSTRGNIRGLSFKEAVMMGLADDGGLLLPESIPQLTTGDLDALAKLAYPELAFQILSHYISDIPAADLKTLIDRSYASFDHEDITPVVTCNGLHILELFHGPTLAFKDVALQLLGNLFEYLLSERQEKMNIIGATSGDTGSAAIYGVRGKANIRIFILHPHGKVSPIQELQMTTVTDDNVFNIAIDGTFDDGQRIVKEIFGDIEFKQRHALGAVNSINWARVLAQIVYYFYAWGRVSRSTGQKNLNFSVPTGNFGDIFAGYVARKMGLPINQLILATNSNNILTRFVNDNDYSIGEVHPTVSPSMDIQIASNFERYLFYLLDQDSSRLARAMQEFSATGRLSVDSAELARVQTEFRSLSINDRQTVETIRDFHQATGYTLDPHTATGVRAALDLKVDETPTICLATAHPAKFRDAVIAATGHGPDIPASLENIEQREKRCVRLPANTATIRDYLQHHCL